MHTHQKNQKIAISIGVIAVIGILGVAMTASMYVPEQRVANPSAHMPIKGGTEPDRLVIPAESGSQDTVPGDTNSDTMPAEISPSMGMPVPENDESEMIVSNLDNDISNIVN